jgi:hypothetical protein
MTIAAGFIHSEGVLLASDTLHEGPGYKFYDPKLRHCNCPAGKVAFAYAGNTRAALAAIRKHDRALEGFSGSIGTKLERLHTYEYTQKILNDPAQAYDSNFHYDLLIAVRPKGRPVELYLTSRLSFTPVNTFECIGIGEALARYIIRPVFSTGMEQSTVVHIAAYALAAVKDNVQGCGGSTRMLSIHHDGTLQDFYAEPSIGHIERSYPAFDFLSRKLFFAHLNTAASAEDFDRNLQNFSAELRGMRQKWLEAVKS